MKNDKLKNITREKVLSQCAFRIISSIYEGTFCQTAFSYKLFSQKIPSSIFERPKYVYDPFKTTHDEMISIKVKICDVNRY